ncbi:SRA stem-loop-interacting RNA-binding protein, mitochondrial [Strongyloides ratti]|uniref:SRA stem-loop-interacting RNA-binding protein, mitochondrial n=1 Tax=Strongyloides ratti TaxID=34506 RepID=A0A090LJ92_STRRB|nr:SRA stem-loop-interacting RNA-binding protein, mitochondrial [Strongyloides ratti]CEF69778.1 SRA stem-loop-interacting RNA-binding protein, mitochondrial [Strongyloides ratti]
MNTGKLLLKNFLKLNIRNFSNENKTVYLTHVKWITGKGQIEKYFSRFGKIKDVSLFFDPETGLHRGYASIEFQTPESALKTIEKGPHVIDGDLVNVELNVPNFKDSTKFKTENM